MQHLPKNYRESKRGAKQAALSAFRGVASFSPLGWLCAAAGANAVAHSWVGFGKCCIHAISNSSLKVNNVCINRKISVKGNCSPIFPDFYKFITVFLILINILFFGIIFLSFFLYSSPGNIVPVMKNGGIDAVRVTLGSVPVTSGVNLLLGIPVAAFIARNNNILSRIIDLITLIPIVIPPSVAGLALLISYGRSGLVAEALSFLEINLAFTFWAIVAAQVLVTLPIFIQIMKNGFKSIEKEILESAALEGADEKRLLFYIYLPLSIKYLITAVILSLLRSAGEFGATIMFAGNLQGKTQTLTTAIYAMSEYNIQDAVSLALVLILLFTIPLLVLKLLVKNKD